MDKGVGEKRRAHQKQKAVKKRRENSFPNQRKFWIRIVWGHRPQIPKTP